MLRGLCLQLLRGGDPGHQRQVDEERVLAAFLVAHLANRLNERQRFDVADRAADLDNRDIHVGGHLAAGGLDFVGDVRNHLHGFAEIVAAPFAGDDVLVNAPDVSCSPG